MANILWGAANAPDAPTWATLAGLAAGGYALSSTIDNTAGLFEQAVFDFGLPAFVNCGAGAPFIGLTLLYAPDNTNYPSPPGNSAAATGIPQVASIAAVASASFMRGHSARFEILPFKLRILLFNGLGVALPSSGNFTANLYRFGETVG